VVAKAQHWVFHVLLSSVFGLWAAAATRHLPLCVAPTAEVHAADHRDPSSGSSHRGADDVFDLSELEDSDDDSTQRPVSLVVLSPDKSVEHAVRQGDVRQHPAVEPETPPPRA
jgi:hypothetical protein